MSSAATAPDPIIEAHRADAEDAVAAFAQAFGAFDQDADSHAWHDSRGRFDLYVPPGVADDAKVRVHVNVPSDKVALLDAALLRAGYKTRTAWLRAEIDGVIAADQG